MKLRICSIALLLAILMLIASCATMGGMSNKKKLTMAIGMYNSQYMQYMNAVGFIKTADGEWVQVREPELTEEKKEILRTKKEILTEVYSLIQLYEAMVMGTSPWSATTEQELFNLIDQLAAMTGGGE